jgi:hypothetical protein
VFAWTYEDLKAILLELAQHRIELDISIPPTHQTKYRLNPFYVITIKHDIDKLLASRFVQPINKATWLSPIVVVPKKNGKLRICVHFRKLNKATKKNPYPLSFCNEILNIVARYEAYSFLNGYLGYHEFFIAPEYRYKTTFVID